MDFLVIYKNSKQLFYLHYIKYLTLQIIESTH